MVKNTVPLQLSHGNAGDASTLSNDFLPYTNLPSSRDAQTDHYRMDCQTNLCRPDEPLIPRERVRQEPRLHHLYRQFAFYEFHPADTAFGYGLKKRPGAVTDRRPYKQPI